MPVVRKTALIIGTNAGDTAYQSPQTYIQIMAMCGHEIALTYLAYKQYSDPELDVTTTCLLCASDLEKPDGEKIYDQTRVEIVAERADLGSGTALMAASVIAGCGHRVWLTPSGWKLVGSKHVEFICTDCKEEEMQDERKREAERT